MPPDGRQERGRRPGVGPACRRSAARCSPRPVRARPPRGADDLGMLTGHIVRLGEVVGQPEQLPAVLAEVPAPDRQILLVEHAGRDVVGCRLPAIVDDRAGTEHLEVLRRAGVGCGRVREGGPDARPVNSLLCHAVDDGGSSIRWRRPAWATGRSRAPAASGRRCGHRCPLASARRGASSSRRARCSASRAGWACCPPMPTP